MANGVVYLAAPNKPLVALDASSGATLWVYPHGGIAEYNSAAVANGTLYMATSHGPNSVYAFRL